MAQAYVEVPLCGKRGAGRVTLVDADDYELVRQHRWWLTSGEYLYATTDISGRRVGMHVLITGFQKTDHSDGNGLDNRRSNLRDGADGKNEYNQRAQLNRSSGYKGVWKHDGTRWRAAITVAGKRHYLGVFKNEEDAARSYDTAAKQHFGEYAWLNFPE